MKKMLFTGAYGFVGSSIKPILDNHFSITTLGLEQENDIRQDITSENTGISLGKYDIVLHACGLAHREPRTEEERKKFYDINFQGTVNLCTMLESNPPSNFFFLSTVAVYGCESGENIDENHPLNGKSAYALSKIRAEQFLQEWCEQKSVILTIFRPSLIAGKNPPGNLGAMIEGIQNNRYLSIDGGRARKSILQVEDIATLIKCSYDKGGSL